MRRRQCSAGGRPCKRRRWAKRAVHRLQFIVRSFEPWFAKMLDPDEHDVQKALPELDPILSSGSRRTDGRHSGSGEGLKSWDPTPLILACLPAWPWPTTKQKVKPRSLPA
ncbi:hypothetical protein MPTK1_6g16940 [Marchantia polymorpha subsp. ruderalis]|uniref:Uncharacterized protein n=2 Tax=Marchantia polymorpha TaxID=3197 RepID=A0AAF6BSV7_MARPO|nr:hypothetical protein MARPO_0144s0020 [Marchantia polymorpha]BBN15091.1 hypothetical protein Mp_6g16940 [Marchantia polymorpha subsp. ruderalis]|eukprot:PTQ29302.1 hypothetical protein MARPO_0144s0020 [Marchantia polymorpha]